jgi:hypothetical protein
MLELKDQITQLVEFAGVVTILTGGSVATAHFFAALRTRGFDEAYRRYWPAAIGRVPRSGDRVLVSAVDCRQRVTGRR